MSIICTLLSLFTIALFARIILSWFPMREGTALAGIYGILFTVTEPVLGPLRRIIPPVGGSSMRLDLSPIIVLVGIQIIQSQMGCSGLFS